MKVFLNLLFLCYRDSLFTLIESYQYEVGNVFEREPFIAKFRSNKIGSEWWTVCFFCFYFVPIDLFLKKLKYQNQMKFFCFENSSHVALT